MFNITKLTMTNFNGTENFDYDFSAGINYFKGANSSGKTEFYNFIDFMFGGNNILVNNEIYKYSWKESTIFFTYNGNSFFGTRTRNLNENYFGYINEYGNTPSIDHAEYKEKLNSVFAQNIQELKELREFTGEDLSYRSFTMFNFLSEKNQGDIQDFFSKCNEIQYSLKLNPILNYIFNKNIEEIFEKQKRVGELTAALKEYEDSNNTSAFIVSKINENLKKLEGSDKLYYTGNNKKEIAKFIESVMSMSESVKKDSNKNISDLEITYNSITEQIKIYESSVKDAKQFKKESENRKIMLETLKGLIDEQPNMKYLTSPIEDLLEEINETIYFSNYIITDKTIANLRKQRQSIADDIRQNDSKYKCYSLSDKEKAIAVIDDYLQYEFIDNSEKIAEIKKEIKSLKTEIKSLQNSDDVKKINDLSNIITQLYKSANSISDVVKTDVNKNGFSLKYIKKGNIIQPVITDIEKDEAVNYYTGSLARHTLMQLCGYLGFLNLMVKEDKYPLIPMLVIDHISKPFDDDNKKAIGAIINEFYNLMNKDNVQIFVFDDEDYDKLNIDPNATKNLVENNKTGFNPFFKPTTKA